MAELRYTVTLPGGYADDAGHVHREAELTPLDGLGEDTAGTLLGEPCAVLTTQLLLCCVKRVGALEAGPTLVRDLLVQDRDYLLLRLREMTLGTDLWITLACPADGCGEPMEAKLALDQVPVAARPTSARFHTLDTPAGEIEFRLPTGADLEWLAVTGLGAPAEARSRLLARCIRRAGGRDGLAAADALALDPAVGDTVEAAMERLAPDVALELEGTCPACGRRFEAPVDLAYHALTDLVGNARTLERQVHLLAWHYHWSERDILSMARHKRERYVRLVEDELQGVADGWSAWR
jgi:hypothetical protein